ncbi:MAG: hypothetical protein ISS92_01155 [Candidatus Omnitrophica bacterium]|nr:hypothetical protein [Candidatus Omnitrophota bacterium]
MFIRNLGKNERTLLAICITLATVAILYSLIIEPVLRRWKTLNAQLVSKIVQLNKNTKLLNMYQSLEEEYAKYHGVIEISKNEEEEQAKALREIENVSKKSACHIVNIRPRASRKLGNYKEILFEITTGGSLDELSRFLYEIEASTEHLRVRQFTITSRLSSSHRLKGIFLIGKIILG